MQHNLSFWQTIKIHFDQLCHYIAQRLLELSQLATVIEVVAVFGVWFAARAYYRDHQKILVERELATYNELAKEYRSFLGLCIEHPRFDACSDAPGPALPAADTEEGREVLLILDTLTSLFESAYYEYNTVPHRTSFKTKQWTGWHELILSWMKRSDYQKAWPYLSPMWDSDFSIYMEKNWRVIEATTGTKVIRPLVIIPVPRATRTISSIIQKLSSFRRGRASSKSGAPRSIGKKTLHRGRAKKWHRKQRDTP